MFSRLHFKIFTFIFSIFWVNNLVAASSDIEVRIALRAHHGAEKSLLQWQATADYLSTSIPNYHFTMVPFEQNSELDQAVSRGGFDFILTNPASTIEHKIRYQTKQLTTLVNKRQGQGYMQFGSVIFTRADNNDINNFEDLKDKVFMAVDEKGFGGWLVAKRELLKNKINPLRDFKQLRFAGGIQRQVVYAVRDGKVDAGSVRTDMLERMAAKGQIDLSKYKVIGQKKRDDFKFLLSTPLYPEWAFSQAHNTSNSLAVKVLYALLELKPDSRAAQSGKYLGWVRSLDYSSVHDLMYELGVGPFERTAYSVWTEFWSLYGLWVLLAAIVLLLITALVVYKCTSLRKELLKD